MSKNTKKEFYGRGCLKILNNNSMEGDVSPVCAMSQNWPRGYKTSSSSTQLSMNFFPLINVEKNLISF